ncbi:VRR-NUC domain-containing protein [Ralstonia syzygii subsp. celebesensis]|nr:VRR-NUC domain-containing protein [Ralstonia syzygii]QQV54358.1 VRR-NUC domain-containing protein [Ralstonia syzygii subsp. celebesensis]CCA79384.1 putative phage protein p43 [blood disease bacterium R229]
MRESDIEDYLVTRVKVMGGEVRKVQWIGRNGAPDRLVMLPARPQIWFELKAPGKAATFPANAHERVQHREHERMRAMGQRVEVVDSYAGVDKVLGW